ncbi:hypothetical protein EDC04DRAFT_2609853, partial [Pisolithus marmoratus]
TFNPPPLSMPKTLAALVDMILSTMDSSVKQIVSVSGDNLTRVVEHKYGSEAARSAGLAAGTTKNIVAVYLDMHDVGRRAIIKMVGRETSGHSRSGEGTHDLHIEEAALHVPGWKRPQSLLESGRRVSELEKFWNDDNVNKAVAQDDHLWSLHPEYRWEGAERMNYRYMGRVSQEATRLTPTFCAHAATGGTCGAFTWTRLTGIPVQRTSWCSSPIRPLQVTAWFQLAHRVYIMLTLLEDAILVKGNDSSSELFSPRCNQKDFLSLGAIKIGRGTAYLWILYTRQLPDSDDGPWILHWCWVASALLGAPGNVTALILSGTPGSNSPATCLCLKRVEVPFTGPNHWTGTGYGNTGYDVASGLPARTGFGYKQTGCDLQRYLRASSAPILNLKSTHKASSRAIFSVPPDKLTVFGSRKAVFGFPPGQNRDTRWCACYVGTPTGEYDKKKALILLTDYIRLDVFKQLGTRSTPMHRLAYLLTTSQRRVTGQLLPTICMAILYPRTLGTTGPEGPGCDLFAVTGYCFGGRYAIDLACDQVVDVVVVAHPSQVVVPTTFETLAQKAKAPFLLEMGSEDNDIPVPKQEEIDAILGGGKYAPGYKRDCWPGCPHGFAVRGDILDTEQFAGKEGSFNNSIAWLELVSTHLPLAWHTAWPQPQDRPRVVKSKVNSATRHTEDRSYNFAFELESPTESRALPSTSHLFRTAHGRMATWLLVTHSPEWDTSYRRSRYPLHNSSTKGQYYKFQTIEDPEKRLPGARHDPMVVETADEITEEAYLVNGVDYPLGVTR